jgi:hypothetical protein
VGTAKLGATGDIYVVNTTTNYNSHKAITLNDGDNTVNMQVVSGTSTITITTINRYTFSGTLTK